MSRVQSTEQIEHQMHQKLQENTSTPKSFFSWQQAISTQYYIINVKCGFSIPSIKLSNIPCWLLIENGTSPTPTLY
jgi:hypothetical protein